MVQKQPQRLLHVLHCFASKLRAALAAAAGSMLALRWPSGPWPLDPRPFGRWSRRTPVTLGSGRCRHSSLRYGMAREPTRSTNDQRSTRLPVPDEAGQGGCQIAPSNFESLSSYARNRGPRTFVQSSRGNAKEKGYECCQQTYDLGRAARV
jgi:hypothetical protein